MKKIITLMCFCLIAGYSFAQLEKGGWIITLEGNGKFSNYRENFKSSSLYIKPGVMKLLAKNLALGINIRVLSERHIYPPFPDSGSIVYKEKTFSLEAGPVLRKYFGDYRLRPYAEMGIGFEIQNTNYFRNNNKTLSGSSFGVHIRPMLGISYWINENVSVDLKGGYDYNMDNPYDNWILNLGFSLKLH